MSGNATVTDDAGTAPRRQTRALYLLAWSLVGFSATALSVLLLFVLTAPLAPGFAVAAYVGALLIVGSAILGNRHA